MQKLLQKPSQVTMMAIIVVKLTDDENRAQVSLNSQKVVIPTEVQLLVDQYSNILFMILTSLPPHRMHDHKIVLKDETSQINVKPYRYPTIQKD